VDVENKDSRTTELSLICCRNGACGENRRSVSRKGAVTGDLLRGGERELYVFSQPRAELENLGVPTVTKRSVENREKQFGLFRAGIHDLDEPVGDPLGGKFE